MLRSLHSMKGFKLAASDGEFGRVKDFLFDEEYWTVRYMVADTGRWIPFRKVLVSPVSLGTPDWDEGSFPVRLTKEQVKHQPDLDEDAPVSRRHEQQWYKAYGYPYYYTAGSEFAWGYGVAPIALINVAQLESDIDEDREIDEETCLRSLEEVRNYHIEAPDGVIGWLEDMIMDEQTWAVRYLKVSLEERLPDRSIYLAPDWFESIDWAERKLLCGCSRKTVDSAPAFHHDTPITPAREKQLLDYFKGVSR